MENLERMNLPSRPKAEQKILSQAELSSQIGAQMTLAEMMGAKSFEDWVVKYAAAFRELMNEEPEYAGRIMVEGIEEEASVELFQEIIGRLNQMVPQS